MEIFSLLLAVALLLWGRQLFWMFTGAAGFMFGLQLATRLLPGPAWLSLAVAVVMAILAAMIAIFIKKLAIGVAGFLMGGIVFGMLAGFFGLGQGVAYWGFFLVGGVAGVILLGLFFDLALIWLSSAAGTLLLYGMMPLAGIARVLISVVILFVGVIIQTSQWDKNED